MGGFQCGDDAMWEKVNMCESQVMMKWSHSLEPGTCSLWNQEEHKPP